MEASSGKRRVWPAEERQRIVAEAMAPNASVAAVALQHGVNANLLFKWISRSRQGLLDRRRGLRLGKEGTIAGRVPVFVPVEIVDPSAPAPTLLPQLHKKARRPASLTQQPGRGRPQGAMEIALPNGVRLSLDSDIAPEALRGILSTLVGL
ncbi:transposase [Lichenihabitans sp. Uapishka_5]|uniref:IS66-like element accessory protein TnpA n=1 Tax=Lichenihabitans sp. Uapishka_5 TaxID=3037302 RepID=UPI0029E826F1|nr:transposase [Lichenihabitans sp. Uapishka_5]MDX7951774.1 transposase [Lichenihabitans sp. Uapishka_5]